MDNKKSLIIFIVVIFLAMIAGGVVAYIIFQTNTTNTLVEKTKNSSGNKFTVNSDGQEKNNSHPSSGDVAPLYLTTMTHLENDWNIDTNEIFFKKTVEEIRYGMDLAERYKAIFTFESGESFAKAITNFDDNVMKEALDRGHGVGTHVDLSAKQKMSVEAAAQIVKEHKDLVDALVGAENNISCSGVSAKSDWYAAAKGGGCKLIDGVVGFAYLSMSMKNRPEGWTDAVILNEKFHYPAPVGDDRFYPFWISDSEDFVADVDGDILLSSGETFSLAMFAEAGGRNGDRPECENDCPLTTEDVTAVVDDLKDFVTIRDSSKITKYNVYLPSNLFVPENEMVLKQFLLEMEKLQKQGIIQWASQKDVYEAKLAERSLTE